MSFFFVTNEANRADRIEILMFNCALTSYFGVPVAFFLLLERWMFRVFELQRDQVFHSVRKRTTRHASDAILLVLFTDTTVMRCHLASNDDMYISADRSHVAATRMLFLSLSLALFFFITHSLSVSFSFETVRWLKRTK